MGWMRHLFHPMRAVRTRDWIIAMRGSPARRSVRLPILLTPEEAERLDDCASALGMTRSDYVRFVLEAMSLTPIDPDNPISSLRYIDAETWRKLLMEFRIHGVNLNQAAKACNTLVRTLGPHLRHGRDDADEMAEFSRTLKEVRNILGALLDENRELDRRFRDALSVDTLVKIDRGWHHARAQD